VSDSEPPPPSAIPSRKVGFGALSGAIASILAWMYSDITGHSFPPGIEAAFATVVTVLTAYLVRNRVDVDAAGPNDAAE